jgi:hypothetical protein
MRHPRELGVAHVEAFLSMLANERKVSTGGTASRLYAMFCAQCSFKT